MCLFTHMHSSTTKFSVEIPTRTITTAAGVESSEFGKRHSINFFFFFPVAENENKS